MALIQREVRKSTNPLSIKEKENRARLKNVGLVNATNSFFL